MASSSLPSIVGGASNRGIVTGCAFSGGSAGMPLGAAFVAASVVAVLSEDLSDDLAAALSLDFDAAGFDSFAAEAGTTGGVGEGDAAATSFGSAVGEGAGACARAADACA